jgi:competence protein ComEC
MNNNLSITRFWKQVFLLIGFLILVIFLGYQMIKEKPLVVAFLDVGQGDAIFIQAPNGNQVVIDGGPGRAIATALGRVMPFGDRSIDMIVATHADADHIAGLVTIMEQYHVDMFVDPGLRADTVIDRALVSTIQKQNIPYVVARRGMRFILDQKRGIFLETLWPEKTFGVSDRNETSIVFRLVYGDTAVLLTGDAVIANEYEMVSHGDMLRANILKAGHHGSKTSTGNDFVQSVQPEFGVLSYGCNNRYGHPHKEVLDVLNKHNVQILGTCDFGTIIFRSDGNTIWLHKTK